MKWSNKLTVKLKAMKLIKLKKKQTSYRKRCDPIGGVGSVIGVVWFFPGDVFRQQHKNDKIVNVTTNYKKQATVLFNKNN
jgi:hypothetical protein